MTKDSILQTLDINKELIKNTFNIDDNGVNNIITFLKENHKDFKDVIDSIFLSNMNDREKMVLYYLIGYDNGIRQKRLNDNKRKL
jgi:hypothetical protein